MCHIEDKQHIKTITTPTPARQLAQRTDRRITIVWLLTFVYRSSFVAKYLLLFFANWSPLTLHVCIYSYVMYMCVCSTQSEYMQTALMCQGYPLNSYNLFILNLHTHTRISLSKLSIYFAHYQQVVKLDSIENWIWSPSSPPHTTHVSTIRRRTHFSHLKNKCDFNPYGLELPRT